MARLAVARLSFCSNSFNPRRTRLAELLRHEWTEGQPAFAHPRAPRSEIDGLAAFLAARPGWEVTMLRCAAAPAGGPLAAEVLGAWLFEVEQALRPGRFDALYLSLHGACQAEGDPGADTTVLRRLRMAARRLPIVATFGNAANISDEVPLLLDASSMVRGPGDGATAAGRVLTMLEGLLAGRIRPIGAVARVPALAPPAQLQRVMQEVWRDAPPAPHTTLLDASVSSGFAWADTAWTGPAALVWADRDARTAREVATRLALRLARGRDHGVGEDTLPPAEAVARAAARGRTLVLDPADDPDMGGLGDTPELLRAMLATAAEPSAIGVLADPRALGAAHGAGEGAVVDLLLGACLTSLYGAPVAARLRVGRLLPDMAVLHAGPVAILVADRPTVAGPALLHAAGIDPGSLRVLALKGGETVRAAFSPAFPEALTAGCPGPSSYDLARLPFTYVAAARRAPEATERYAEEQQRAAEAAFRGEHRRAHAQRDGLQRKAASGTQVYAVA